MNRFIVADAASCIGCHVCEIACVTAHHQDVWPQQRRDFLPRIHIVFHRKESRAATCHHCNDAPCVTSCPTQALYLANDSIQLRQAQCIGCKNCVLACPFGAIEMTSSAADAPQLAQKCDLCSEHASGQQACVAACPTQALKLMDDAGINQLRRERQLRAAQGLAVQPRQRTRRETFLEKLPRVGAKKSLPKRERPILAKFTTGLRPAMRNTKANAASIAPRKHGATGPVRCITTFRILFALSTRAMSSKRRSCVIKAALCRRFAAGFVRRIVCAKGPVH